MKRKIYGWLKLMDGSEIDLDGQNLETVKKQIGKRGIRTYKTPDLGDESNIFVTHPDQMVTNLKAVRELFK